MRIHKRSQHQLRSCDSPLCAMYLYCIDVYSYTVFASFSLSISRLPRESRDVLLCWNKSTKKEKNRRKNEKSNYIGLCLHIHRISSHRKRALLSFNGFSSLCAFFRIRSKYVVSFLFLVCLVVKFFFHFLYVLGSKMWCIIRKWLKLFPSE